MEGKRLKHCHFCILYNELPFLKQKMKFLYEHFDQLIFFDLNITKMAFSTDGSHEFIANYPDPEKKITLIEKRNLNDVKRFYGRSFVQKQKMFAVGSQHVRKDIDVFWCPDLDEFFDEQLIRDVEELLLTNPKAMSIQVPHMISVKQPGFVYQEKDGSWPLMFSRIARHVPGTVYSHCEIHKYQKPYVPIGTESRFWHYAFIGEARMKHKMSLYKASRRWYQRYRNANTTEEILKLGHASTNWKIVEIPESQDQAPSYVDMDEMLKDLETA